MKRLVFHAALFLSAALCRSLADEAADTQYYLYDIDQQLHELNERAENQAREAAGSPEKEKAKADLAATESGDSILLDTWHLNNQLVANLIKGLYPLGSKEAKLNYLNVLKLRKITYSLDSQTGALSIRFVPPGGGAS